MILEASDRVLIKEYYEHPRRLTKSERALAKDKIKLIVECAFLDIKIENERR